MTALDLDKFTRIVGLLGSSYDGELLVAARKDNAMLREAGMSWRDFLDAQRQLEVAAEAASLLLAENTDLRAANESLSAELSRPPTTTAWSEVGTANHRVAARWALDLESTGRIYLSPFDFLETCSGWTGRLTAKQQPVFRRIVDGIAERTELVPPP